jgi:hypothetical protein
MVAVHARAIPNLRRGRGACATASIGVWRACLPARDDRGDPGSAAAAVPVGTTTATDFMATKWTVDKHLDRDHLRA